MAKKSILPDVVAAAQNRRSFVRKLGLATAGGAAAVMAGNRLQATPLTDGDILNFALNLEYLEAEFYTVATTGGTIDKFGIGTDGSGTPGPTTGGAMVHNFNRASLVGNLNDIALEIAYDERTHVTLLRTALQSFSLQPIAKPAINLNALGFGFASPSEFLLLGRIFEDIGVSAYGGAAPLLQSKIILATAARILATEAEHVGNLRAQIAAMNLRSSPIDGADIPPPPSGKYFSVNQSALTEVRTPPQVLYLAYGNKANATSGGFFPNGVNGAITMSSGPASAN